MTAPSTINRGTAEPLEHVAAVLLLNAATGIVEAVCFAHLGGVFAAFVTGTVVLAGVHIARGGMSGIPPYGISFLGFIVGGALGGLLLRRRSASPSETVRMVLTAEAAGVTVATACSLVAGTPGRDVALGILAIGMAMQFSATKTLKVTDVGFAALTGLIHGTIQDLVQQKYTRLPRRLLGIAGVLIGAIIGGAISLASVPLALIVALPPIAAAALLAARPDDTMTGTAGPGQRNQRSEQVHHP